jgi:hypothetical protein
LFTLWKNPELTVPPLATVNPFELSQPPLPPCWISAIRKYVPGSKVAGPKDTGPEKSEKVALEKVVAPEVRPFVKRKSNVPPPKPIPSEIESTLVAADRLNS